MTDDIKKYMRAILGVVVAVIAWQILAATNIVGFAAESQATDDGKLGSVSIGTAIPVIEAIASFVIGWAFFFFGRLGDATISGLRALLGFDQSISPVTTSNSQAITDFNDDMRALYAAIQAKRQAAMIKTSEDVSASIKTWISETTDKVNNG